MGKHYFVGLLALAAIVCALFFSIAHCLGRSPHSAANHRERAIAKSSARNAPEFTRPAARKSLARRAASKPQARFFTTQTTFEPNVGQARPEAAFVGRGKGIAVLLEPDGFSVQVPDRSNARPTATTPRENSSGKCRTSLMGRRRNAPRRNELFHRQRSAQVAR